MVEPKELADHSKFISVKNNRKASESQVAIEYYFDYDLALYKQKKYMKNIIRKILIFSEKYTKEYLVIGGLCHSGFALIESSNSDKNDPFMYIVSGALGNVTCMASEESKIKWTKESNKNTNSTLVLAF